MKRLLMILLLLCNYTIYAQVMRISGRSYKDDQVMYESTFGGIPALTNGLVGRTENGSIIRLDGASGGKYKIYVQDNLTAIGKIAVTMHGHKVID